MSINHRSVSRRRALMSCMTRLRVATSALLGRPVAYRLNIDGSTWHVRSGTVIAECYLGPKE